VAVADSEASANSPLADDRYAAIIASLLGARTDHAGARFDAEIDAAVADGRVDRETARTLRWWQRASVRAVEDYAATAIPAALAGRDDAEGRAVADADETAESWRQAQSMARTRGDAATAGIRWNHPARLVAVPQLADAHPAGAHPADAPLTDRADQQAAVRAAFRSPERKDDDGHAHPATTA
jgi:hypothetical protein